MTQQVMVEPDLSRRSTGFGQRLLTNQAFWVTVALVLIAIGMYVETNVFWTRQNFYNFTRNFSFIALMALGQTAVIITGGIDLSVGSIMGVTGVIVGKLMSNGYSFWLSAAAGLGAALLAGLVNGALIAYVRLSPFVVTLGMLSIGRSLALVISENQMFYQLGPDQPLLLELGGGSMLGVTNPVWAMVILALIFGFMLNFTVWGRHVYAVGGNEQAAQLTGVPVDWVKISVYLLSAFTAAIAAILMIGWLGSVTNALGQNYELQVIASTVIGGANLMGGEGSSYGALVGAALIEIIRNSLRLAGVDANWQGAFIGLFILFAVLLGRFRGRRSA